MSASSSTDDAASETPEWHEDGRTTVWRGSEKRPMYLASRDIETAFDAARPRRMAKIVVNQDVHGWITAALSRELAGMEGDLRTCG